MFNSLTGIVTGRGPNALYLATGGVEWELEVSGFTQRRLASEQHDEIRIFTYLYHREDQMRLYGFATSEERTIFLELTRVSGIGPRAAIKLLSATSPSELVRALEAEDVDSLVRLPGLGRKTAQKIILTLRGRLVGDEHAVREHSELAEGLVEMGFDAKQVATVITDVALELDGESTGDAGTPNDPATREQEIFRRAIVRLSGE